MIILPTIINFKRSLILKTIIFKIIDYETVKKAEKRIQSIKP